ncbi:unnamed protein product [Amoebophrya sp. A120]|nr:unnamed protein product [Amoebophrya sp. A120]|eukprot:GSA120T00005967001.1
MARPESVLPREQGGVCTPMKKRTYAAAPTTRSSASRPPSSFSCSTSAPNGVPCCRSTSSLRGPFQRCLLAAVSFLSIRHDATFFASKGSSWGPSSSSYGVSALADLKAEDFQGVTVLTSDTFEDYVTNNKHVLVQFYAPWCGHCKQFRHEFLKAAQKLQERDPPIPLAVVDATSEAKLAELYGVRGYPTLKFFVEGRDMEYAGGRMWDNIVAWVEKKAGPILVHLQTKEEVEVFFQAKAHEATPTGTSAVIGGGVIVAFCDDPEKEKVLQEVGVAFDDIFFGIAPNSLYKEVVKPETILRAQAVADQESEVKEVPKVDVSAGDVVYMRFPFDEGESVAPIVTPDAVGMGKEHPEYWERVADDVRFFVAIYSMPKVNVFTGENAALLFNDPRPLLLYLRDEKRPDIATTEQNLHAEIREKNQLIEDSLHSLATKYKQDFVVTFAGAEQPMDMRLMDYISVDYEDLPCIRIIKDPTDGMVKYKLPMPPEATEEELAAESEDMSNDLNYLRNAKAITPEKIEQFAEDFLNGAAKPHLKSQHAPKNNPKDQGAIFTLTGEHFLDTILNHNQYVLVKYYAPWCGHCKKLEPIYKDLAAKYNVPGSGVLIAKFDATINDLPLEVEEVIQGYPTLKLYRKSTDHSVHYVGDRNLDTLIQFVETHMGRGVDSSLDSGGGAAAGGGVGSGAAAGTKDEL